MASAVAVRLFSPPALPSPSSPVDLYAVFCYVVVCHKTKALSSAGRRTRVLVAALEVLIVGLVGRALSGKRNARVTLLSVLLRCCVCSGRW